MVNIIPLIGKKYNVISGCWTGFKGVCVSYDLEHDLPIILQDDEEKWNSVAVRMNEIELIETDDKKDISHLQKN